MWRLVSSQDATLFTRCWKQCWQSYMCRHILLSWGREILCSLLANFVSSGDEGNSKGKLRAEGGGGWALYAQFGRQGDPVFHACYFWFWVLAPSLILVFGSKRPRQSTWFSFFPLKSEIGRTQPSLIFTRRKVTWQTRSTCTNGNMVHPTAIHSLFPSWLGIASTQTTTRSSKDNKWSFWIQHGVNNKSAIVLCCLLSLHFSSECGVEADYVHTWNWDAIKTDCASGTASWQTSLCRVMPRACSIWKAIKSLHV